MSRKDRILALLASMGSDGPKRSLGQNFLVSDSVVDKILAAARSLPFPALIEVGPGLGAITEDLIGLGAPLTLLELDRNFAEMWRSRGLRVIEGDALRVDWRTLELPQQTLFVSNLPYQISSSIVIDRSLEPAGITRMILMFQKEVAQRIAARAGTKEYGLLTVIAQAFWETSTVCDASPRDFYPSPNVASRVLMFRRRVVDIPAAGFLGFTKVAFSHRRKLLARNLLAWRAGLDMASVERVFASRGLKPTARAEELDPPSFVGLYLAMEKEFPRG